MARRRTNDAKIDPALFHRSASSVTLTEDVEFCYKVDNLNSKECDRGIRYNDPAIGVDWGVTDPILSDKDKNAPLLADSDCNFVYGKGE